MDPITSAALIGGAGTLLAGGLNYSGAHKANKMNLQIAREQMDFQERMSNTAYQRTMEDMRLAGLNPILAAKLGGASTPPGASAQIQNEMGPAVNSAMDAKRLFADLQKIKADTNLTSAMEKATLADITNKKTATASQVATNTWSQLEMASKVRLNDELTSNAKTDGINKALDAAINTSAYGVIMKHLEKLGPVKDLAKVAMSRK